MPKRKIQRERERECVCVCVKERERKEGRKKLFVLKGNTCLGHDPTKKKS